MNPVIVFAGSSSKESINKQLANYAASTLENTEYDILDLNDFPLPLFSIDIENQKGFPEKAVEFDDLIENSSGLIISLAEHNGSYSAVFKNLMDWLSRITPKMFRNKPMLLMSTSPGGRGGAGVLAAAMDRFPRHDAKIIETFSLPSFSENFQVNQIRNLDFDKKLIEITRKFEASL